MDLSQLVAAIEGSRAPFEQWQPQHCGSLPIHIDAQGRWLYQDSPIERLPLIQLFARVLKREGDDYFLLTPHEKISITVADAPFLVVGWEYHPHQSELMLLRTNIGSQYPLSATYPLLLQGERLYLDMGHGLHARVHRNVYYQWLEIAEQKVQARLQQFVLRSNGEAFVIAELHDPFAP